MMKIKTTARSVWGLKLIVPVDGEVAIDAEGYAEVSEACAEVLLKATNDWHEAEEEIDEKQDEEDVKAKIEQMDMTALKHLAEELGIEAKEYEKFKTEKAMRVFLLKKYQTA